MILMPLPKGNAFQLCAREDRLRISLPPQTFVCVPINSPLDYIASRIVLLPCFLDRARSSTEFLSSAYAWSRLHHIFKPAFHANSMPSYPDSALSYERVTGFYQPSTSSTCLDIINNLRHHLASSVPPYVPTRCAYYHPYQG